MPDSASTTTIPVTPRISLVQHMRRFAREAMRGLIALAIIGLVAFVLVCALVVLQGQSADLRNSDAVMLAHGDDDAQRAYALDLYRTGHAPRLLIAGRPQARDAILAAGVPQEALLFVEITPDMDDQTRIISLAQQGEHFNVQSVLLVDEPARLLAYLKIAHDHGLAAHGIPLPGGLLDPINVINGTRIYWRYVLLDRL